MSQIKGFEFTISLRLISVEILTTSCFLYLLLQLQLQTKQEQPFPSNQTHRFPFLSKCLLKKIEDESESLQVHYI